ncbi:hypothetical protein [Frankia sp. Cj3]|uniref:hypothetical protein n=1 Tax=Frankia sp. Cj3 TaxID=2880976 RepID=UPI001EF48652|nr:hypothetical protein [Frankia sp. Cj3]
MIWSSRSSREQGEKATCLTLYDRAHDILDGPGPTPAPGTSSSALPISKPSGYTASPHSVTAPVLRSPRDAVAGWQTVLQAGEFHQAMDQVPTAITG